VYLSSFQNVQPNPGAPAPGVAQPTPHPGDAPAQGSQPSGGNPLMTLLPLVIFIPFFFMMFRRNKKEQEARSKLKKGDRIASQSGLVGELVDLDERFAKVKLAPGITVQMLASSIQPLETSAAKSDDKDLKDLKDAKAAAEKK